MDPALDDGEAAALSELQKTRSNLAALLAESSALDKSLAAINNRLSAGLETVAAVSDAFAPLQTQSIAAKALQSRINRAVSPALSVLRSFSLVESLQRGLISLSDNTGPEYAHNLERLLKYVECVDRLKSAIGAVDAGCGPAVMRLQEAVEFLSRTRATDQLRICRLRETLGAIKALYEAEVDAMRYEGLLDEALLRLQDEYEAILQRIKHKIRLEEETELGSDLEIEVLARISETLASNDCLDICIDIYVKARYRRAAKALMRLNPQYLKTYSSEDIDKMEWESLESAITLWIEHFQLAITRVFLAEKRLCGRVLDGLVGGAVWPECFVRIADRIMAVFFRFSEGVARSSKEPQKLFKLLDMLDSLNRLRPEFLLVFDGEAGLGICARFRELQKLLVLAASKVFWEFGLQIEGHVQDVDPSPADGSVPKVVRYAVNYLKCLAGGGYAGAMERVLRTEWAWRAAHEGGEAEEGRALLREAVGNALDAVRRNVETKRRRYGGDKVMPHVLAMNAYWYMYMRTRGSELAKLVGEETMRREYKAAAEAAAYAYQAEAWGTLVGILGDEEEDTEAVFIRELEGRVSWHRSWCCIQDEELRRQMEEAVATAVVPAYARFLRSQSGAARGGSFLPPESIREMIGRAFGGGGGGEKEKLRRKGSLRRTEEEEAKAEAEGEGGGSFGGHEEEMRFRRRGSEERSSVGIRKGGGRLRRRGEKAEKTKGGGRLRRRGEKAEKTIGLSYYREFRDQKEKKSWKSEERNMEGAHNSGEV